MNINYKKAIASLLAVTLVSPMTIHSVAKAESNSANSVSSASTLSPEEVPFFYSTFQHQDSIYLTWEKASNATSYVLKRNGVQIYEGANSDFVDTGLSQDTSYTYELIARNSVRDSAPTTFTTKTVKQSLITLPNIKNVKVTSAEDTITLDYELDQSIQGLIFMYGIGNGLSGTQLTNMNLGHTVFDELEPNTTYTFKIYSSAGAGPGSWYLSPGLLISATTKGNTSSIPTSPTIPTTTVTPTTPAAPVKQYGFVKVWNYLNFRSQPSISSNPIGNLYRNDKVEIVSEDGLWYKVKTNNKEGYVSKLYIQNFDQSDLNELNTAKTGRVNVKSYLNLRSYPSVISKPVEKLYKNEEVKILTDVNGWYKIEAKGKIGYASKQYITNATTTVPKNQGTVNVQSFLNVRKGPSTTYPTTGILLNGSKVEILNTEGSWYKIKYGSGYGYLSSVYVK